MILVAGAGPVGLVAACVIAGAGQPVTLLEKRGSLNTASRASTFHPPTMDILENGAYHRRLLMYKGRERPEALLDAPTADATTLATQGYGVGNYHLVMGDTAKAVAVFERVVTGTGWNAFGFIAAEADLARMAK